ncbi:MAG: glycosyltransferase family 2 protein [Gammaproteobacteria bacterium]|nr:glycosyltransferase family 2 protein [Gammaproteobacteria bacterium]
MNVPNEKVSVIIACTQPEHTSLFQTITGLSSQEKIDRMIEIIVVDAFGVANAEQLRAILPPMINLKVISIPKPNHSAAFNLGVKLASAPLIWFLADDFSPKPGALAAHLRKIEQYTGINTVCIGPGRFRDDLVSHPFRQWLEYEYDLRRMAFRVDEEEMEGFFYVGNTVFYAEYFRSLGGFNESYHHEVVFEQELELRLSQHKAKLIYTIEAMATHIHFVCLRERETAMEWAGESCARLKYDYRVHASLYPDCKYDISGHLQLANRARLLFKSTREPLARQDWWRHRLCASFLKGYQNAWLKIEDVEDFSISAYLRKQQVTRHCVIWKSSIDGCDADGLVQFNTPDSFSEVDSNKEVEFLQVSNPLGAPYIYFYTTPGFAEPNAEVSVTAYILDDKPGKLWIEYDSTDLSVKTVKQRPGAFKRTACIDLRGDCTWRKFEFSIPDGRWQTRQINGGDFRIVRDGGPLDKLMITSAKAIVSSAQHSFQQQTSFLSVPDFRQKIDMQETEEPEVSIIIPMFTRVGYTIQCLQAISANTSGKFEVIVIDDGSPDDSPSWLAAFSGIKFVFLVTNQGFSRACNEGAKQARGKWLVFLNNDTIPQAGWLSALLEEAENHPDAGAIGSCLVYPATGKVQHAGISLDQQGYPYHLNRYETAEDDFISSSRECTAVTGACMFTSRQIFMQCNGFSTRYVNGVEDVDYCLRLRERAYKIRYCGKSIVGHYESLTLGRLDPDSNQRNLALYKKYWIDTNRWQSALESSC